VAVACWALLPVSLPSLRSAGTPLRCAGAPGWEQMRACIQLFLPLPVFVRGAPCPSSFPASLGPSACGCEYEQILRHKLEQDLLCAGQVALVGDRRRAGSAPPAIRQPALPPASCKAPQKMAGQQMLQPPASHGCWAARATNASARPFCSHALPDECLRQTVAVWRTWDVADGMLSGSFKQAPLQGHPCLFALSFMCAPFHGRL